MIEFIKPYLDPKEQKILHSKKTSSDYDKIKSDKIISQYFGPYSIPMASGEDAIKAVVQYTKEKNNSSTITIPDAVCASVYRAAQGIESIHLMDTDSNWNCTYDAKALESDILLFADLSGKRMELPSVKHPGQVLIEDACQCYDGVAGFRETDYSVFSFSKGKQMYAGNGGIISSRHDLSQLKDWIKKNEFEGLMDWQLELIANQVLKINEINDKRKRNGLYLIDKLKNVDWMTLPEKDNHVFLKFIIFITQSEYEKETIPKIPGRSRQILKFMNHMASKGIQVEETYIPIHVRFPENFLENQYKSYNCNHAWIEAITLPCRPDLTDKELDQIADAVKSFDNKRTAKQVFSDNYDTEAFKPAEIGFFKDLFDIKFQRIVDLSKKGDKILDIGCGSGDVFMPLYERGIASGINEYVEIDGVDFVKTFLDEMEEKLKKHPFYGKQPHKLYHYDVTNMDGVENEKYDIVFSYSTLYYIYDIANVFKEIYRVLKPNGYAIVELGNKNSLNNYESRRVSTNVEVHHRGLDELESLIDQAGLIPVKRQCFQVFPLYGGFHNDTASFLVPVLRQIMNVKNDDGIMLDELVSSAPFINSYSFRQSYVLKKDPSAKRYDLGPSHMQYVVDSEAVEFAKLIFQSFKDKKLWREGIGRMIEILLSEPNNALLIYTLMSLHVGKQEKALANKFFQEANILKK